MLVIVVFGASGDLAKRKTYPALFSLFKHDFLTKEFRIYGFARSSLSQNDFHGRLLPFLRKHVEGKEDETLLEEFLDKCEYVSAEYGDDKGYLEVKQRIKGLVTNEQHRLNHVRLYYLALPPSIFSTVCHQIKSNLYNAQKDNRVIIEKPFGRDLESSNELSASLAPLFKESELYRIDHYLGKEMVKNLMILRFANIFFNSVWNRNYISNIQIVFKERLGVEGRGGYFDEFGIIRDVMQNHLLQMLTVIAMERPTTLSAEDIRDEKVKVLRCIKPVTPANVILGQYVANPVEGHHEGYCDDKSIPNDSKTPTFAMATLYIDNERWSGVPFMLRCGKALNEQKAEIRIQFSDVPGSLFPGAARNELVIRVQPNESVYVKMIVKKPGLATEPMVSALDLSYAHRYTNMRIPEAYESLILDAIKGDRSNFVRSDELQHAWRIFTPLLHSIERNAYKSKIDDDSVMDADAARSGEEIKIIPYPHGSRGPVEADREIAKRGFASFASGWGNSSGSASAAALQWPQTKL